MNMKKRPGVPTVKKPLGLSVFIICPPGPSPVCGGFLLLVRGFYKCGGVTADSFFTAF